MVETQTGFQRRRQEEQIDRDTLLDGLKAVHTVSDIERASALLRDGEIATLDEGEKALWSHALARSDVWVLCGPDKASLRIGIRLKLRDRLIALERLLDDAGFRPKTRSGLPTAATGPIGRLPSWRSAKGGSHDRVTRANLGTSARPTG